RSDLLQHRSEIDEFRAEAVIDCRALTRDDAEIALAAFPSVERRIVISSVDVYRAFGALNDGRETDPVPLNEKSPVRDLRYPYRGKMPGLDDYDKLDVEDAYLPQCATVLRLPMVYGEHDCQRREEFILRRVRAGRKRIPIGAGSWLGCRAYAGDVAKAARRCLEVPASAGQVFNICEDRTYSIRMWAQMILLAAGSDAELVRVPDAALPEDLSETGTPLQHIACSAHKARAMLGWGTSDPYETLRTTVRWHLANPPAGAPGDFGPDDRALAIATESV
ncbi:MAG TPA: hypothetical protein VEU76_00675, partial [Candidatus Udaeobacter sp.]|nr:hypothetical protein [Candidatus Udaeobacter sp.]